ncbi:MAG: IS1 family transposase [Fluviicola sp.]|nr:IS1 family transposase [Fluviicola sp.]
MKCNYCSKNTLICKGKRGINQRYQCKNCGKYQQDFYSYKLYNSQDDKKIKILNAEGVGIRSMSRILGYSQGTIIRRIQHLASKVIKPIYSANNEVYEVDEMWSFVEKKKPSNYCWITYAINRRTHEVIDVSFGSRSKENLGKVIRSVLSYKPKKIVTDKLNTYPGLIPSELHDTTRYANNRIERSNLTLRTNIKRLSRKTICFSKSKKMLEACVLLYFDYHYWKICTKK